MTTKYTRERLTELAAGSSSINDMMRRLGVPPAGGTHSYLSKRLKHYGIDTSHFQPARTVYTRELLQEAVAASQSLAGVLRHLNHRQAGGTQAHVARRIAAFGIDTSHFTGQAHNRGKPPASKLAPEAILVKRPLENGRLPGRRIRRALTELGRPEGCEGCGTGPEWLGRPLTLEVDHINGDWSDNRPGNLRLLCPNCHATTDTYCGRNRRDRGATRSVSGRPPLKEGSPADRG
ncbi:HNH endonuclease signature motif containing protein [Kitasatospora indigofera]|uniref:HNH endonuclease signature motif containing protein n=1 Tax=Kitasatospora indigofera TaxID=67307 RepID=UPI0033BA19A1